MRIIDFVPLIQPSNELVAAESDGVGCGVGDHKIADTVLVEFDQCRSPLQILESSGHDRGDVGGVGVNVTCVNGRNGGHGKRTNGRPDAPPTGNYTADQCHTREKLSMLTPSWMARTQGFVPELPRGRVLSRRSR